MERRSPQEGGAQGCTNGCTSCTNGNGLHPTVPIDATAASFVRAHWVPLLPPAAPQISQIQRNQILDHIRRYSQLPPEREPQAGSGSDRFSFDEPAVDEVRPPLYPGHACWAGRAPLLGQWSTWRPAPALPSSPPVLRSTACKCRAHLLRNIDGRRSPQVHAGFARMRCYACKPTHPSMPPLRHAQVTSGAAPPGAHSTHATPEPRTSGEPPPPPPGLARASSRALSAVLG